MCVRKKLFVWFVLLGEAAAHMDMPPSVSLTSVFFFDAGNYMAQEKGGISEPADSTPWTERFAATASRSNGTRILGDNREYGGDY